MCPLCLHYASVRYSYCITSSPSLTEPDGGTAEQNAAYTAEEDNAAASEFRQVSVSYYLQPILRVVLRTFFLTFVFVLLLAWSPGLGYASLEISQWDMLSQNNHLCFYLECKGEWKRVFYLLIIQNCFSFLLRCHIEILYLKKSTTSKS